LKLTDTWIINEVTFWLRKPTASHLFWTDPHSTASDLIPLAVHLTVYGVATEIISDLQNRDAESSKN